jgi:hypothetical protein
VGGWDDPAARVSVDRALRAMSIKIGLSMMNFAQLAGCALRVDIAVLAGTVTRLYDDIIDGGDGDGGQDDRLADLIRGLPFTPGSDLEGLLQALGERIRDLLVPDDDVAVEALSALHEYQCLSRGQRDPAVSLPTLEKISRGKGALASLTLFVLVKPVPPPGTGGRLVYDDEGMWSYDVKLVRGEGDPAVVGENVNHAYDYLGLVRQFYKEKLGRNSIDNAGLDLVANVNFGASFDNAFWDGTRMVFGNGDNVVFKDLTGDLDVPGHELTHGVTQYTAGLLYTPDQTGALNESFSDMMGSAIGRSSGIAGPVCAAPIAG